MCTEWNTNLEQTLSTEYIVGTEKYVWSFRVSCFLFKMEAVDILKRVTWPNIKIE